MYVLWKFVWFCLLCNPPVEEWKAEEKKKMNSEVKRKIREETRDFATEKLVLEDLIQQQAYQLRDIELNLENFKASVVLQLK